MQSIDELAFFINGFQNDRVTRGAVDVDVEYGKKDADPDRRTTQKLVMRDLSNVTDKSVGRRDPVIGLPGNIPLGVSEKSHQPYPDQKWDQD